MKRTLRNVVIIVDEPSAAHVHAVIVVIVVKAAEIGSVECGVCVLAGIDCAWHALPFRCWHHSPLSRNTHFVNKRVVKKR